MDHQSVFSRLIESERHYYEFACNYGGESHPMAQFYKCRMAAMELLQRSSSRELRYIRDKEVEHPSSNSILTNGKLYVRLSHIADCLGLDLVRLGDEE